MGNLWWKKAVSVAMAATLCVSGTPGKILQAQDNAAVKAASTSEADEAGVLKVELDANGRITADNASDLTHQKFSWDNVNMYFVLTDRFKNSDKSNDHSYGRGLQKDGKTPVMNLDIYTNPGTFHGGDLNGLTEKVEDGYFTELGVNAIWITAPYEQIHGYTSGNVKSDNAEIYPDPDKQGFPYYSYHGYWTLDYSNIDANMGTEKDFEKFVDSCHKKGIRVVMDVVMNHVGYTTMKDAIDYGFDGALKDSDDYKVSWEDYYFGDATLLVGGKPESKNFWVQDTDIWASNWWGTGFVRADYKGYTPAKGDETMASLCGLPDVITESDAKEIGTPPLLVNKWKAENRYDKEQGELDAWFASTGNKKIPRNYIIKWLSDYVREYGVDGFRCDTAKHVKMDAWKDLKTECVSALKEWREKNPDKAGADWTDDFWMTGECWGHGLSKSPYFTTGGFDSMINFDFPKSGDISGLNALYSGYAAAINADPEFNGLSYVSSHDDSAGLGVFSADNAKSKNLGTSLLLSPGGVQIFYGNEVNRQLAWDKFFTGSDYLDQRYRSDMDWSAIESNAATKDVLAHWQKVGQFRNKHLSVGGGQHETLSNSPCTFARTYHLEEEDEDKVVCCVPGKAGTYDVNVSEVFEEGETVTNFYTGDKATVSGGTVSFTTSDANEVILIEGSGIVKASVNIKSAVKTETYSVDSFKVTLKANKATDTRYTINDGTPVEFTSGDVITVGGDTAYGEETKITVTGISEDDGSTLTKSVTYKRCEEPEVKDLALCIKVKKSDYKTAPNIWVYTDKDDYGEEKSLVKGAWPGDPMVEDEDYWSYSVEDYEGKARVILIYNGKSNKGTGVPGDLVQGTVVYDLATGAYTNEPAGEAGKVTVNYVDQEGNVLKSIYRVGVIGKKYTTYPAEIEGYTLVKTPDNAVGVFEKDGTVTYEYVSDGGVVKTKAPATTKPAVSPTPGGETPTPATTKPGKETETPSSKPSQTPTGGDKNTPKPSNEPNVTEKPDPTASTGPIDLLEDLEVAVKASKKSPQLKGTNITLTATANNGSGCYEYSFEVKKSGSNTVTTLQALDKGNKVTWQPASAGSYVIAAKVTDLGTNNSAMSTITYTIKNPVLTVSKFTLSKSGKKITMKASATGSKIRYRYQIRLGKKLVKTRGYSTKASYVYKVKKKGTYKVTLSIKSSSGIYSSTKSIRVK